MKVSDFMNSRGDFVPGDFNVIDDVTGFKVKASETSKRWDGFRTARPWKRNEQDFLRGKPEKIRTPWARPEQDNNFTALTSLTVEATSSMVQWQPNTSYTSSDTVIHNGVTYTANTTHTSQSLFIEDFTKWDR